MSGAPNKTGLWDRIVKSFAASHEISDVTQIAELLGLSYQSVYKWKSGLLPSIDTLLKIANLTNSSIQWLLTEEGPKEFKGLKEQLEVPEPQFLGLKQQLKSPQERFQSVLNQLQEGVDTTSFKPHEKKVIEDIAAAGGISVEETIVHLVREALAMKGVGTMPDLMPVPVFQMMDDELFLRLDQLPEAERKAERERLIGRLVMDSVNPPQ